MKRKLFIVFVVLPLLVLVATASQARPADPPAPAAKKAACDPSWKLLPIPESEQGDIYLITPLGNIFVSRNGTVYGAYSKWVRVGGKKTTVIALLYWAAGGKVVPKLSLGYTLRAKTGGFVVSYITTVGSSGPGVAIGGDYVTAPGPGALDHKLPLLFEWDGRKLAQIPLDDFGEGQILAVNGGWVTGYSSTERPLMLRRGTNGWDPVTFPEELLPKDLDGRPRGYFDRIEVRGTNDVLFTGESGFKRIAFVWDGRGFTPTTVPAKDPDEEIPSVTKEELRRLGIGPPRFIKIVGNSRWLAAYGFDRKQSFVLRRRVCEPTLATSG